MVEAKKSVQTGTGVDYVEMCRNCPLHSGLEETLDMVKKKACSLDQKCDERRREMWPHIHSKISKKEFWAILTIFVVILGSIVGYIADGQATYQKDHTVLHKEINIDMKDQREKVSDKISQISENMAVTTTILKTLAEKKND